MRIGLILGAVLAGLALTAAVLSALWTPYDITRLAIAQKLLPPSPAHWLGTDHLGRDILSMAMLGAQTSLAVALAAVVIGMGLGVPLGLLAAARRGGWLDEVVMRGNDLIFANLGQDTTSGGDGNDRLWAMARGEESLALELRRRGLKVGAAALCGGGGQGDALILHAPSQA